MDLKTKFLRSVIDVVKMEEIPSQLILNWDQTGLHLVPASNWTMANKGSKRVEMKGIEDKRHITCTAIFVARYAENFFRSNVTQARLICVIHRTPFPWTGV